MEIMHVESRYKGVINFENIHTDSLPEKIALFTTVQFMDHIEKIKEYLEEKGKEVSLPSTNATYNGQVLGCSIKKFEGIDCILYIGDGEFHPTALALENELPVYTFNPFNEHFKQLEKEKIDEMLKIQRAGIAKFYHSEKIGILISLKPGQLNNFAKNELMKKYPDKKFFTFIFDTLDPGMLENFNFIDCFVNTACPRISFDDYSRFKKRIVYYKYLLH